MDKCNTQRNTKAKSEREVKDLSDQPVLKVKRRFLWDGKRYAPNSPRDCVPYPKDDRKKMKLLIMARQGFFVRDFALTQFIGGKVG